MLKKLSDFLAGIPMTVTGGVFLAVSLVMMLSGIEFPVDPAWITVLICGVPLVYLALTRLLWQKWISSALLITIAMIAAISIGELFAAGEVAFIMAIGAILEDLTVARAKKGIGKLISLVPQTGRRIRTVAGKEKLQEVRADEIRVGDLLRVLPGEAIPVDGEIFAGNTSVDQSVMTGESLPVDKKTGDTVFCGTINRFGAIDIRAMQVGKDSSLQKMIDLVKEAENKQAPTQRIVDRWATRLVPIALLIAVATYLITWDVNRAVTVLVVFCSCALVLATPTSIMAAIGQATKKGVLIKSGEALEKMGKVDCVAFDKTGTLTFGRLEVCDMIPASEEISENELLKLAASVETRSEHPLGKAIISFAAERHITLAEPENFIMSPGKGVSAQISGKNVFCGSSAYLRENGAAISGGLEKTLEKLRSEGKASVLTACGKVCVGIVALSDILRPAAPDVVARVKTLGTDVVLLTGDHTQAAEYFAGRTGIAKVKAELLPEQKVAAIQELKDQNHTVCMIGDGVNDAPALKTADVGVAMGSMGSAIAVEAADIALMSDDIDRIPYLKRLSNSTIATIKFNICLSMAINFVAIALSVAGVLNPITGALVHNAGSVLVVLNAALLYDRKFEEH